MVEEVLETEAATEVGQVLLTTSINARLFKRYFSEFGIVPKQVELLS